MKLEYLNILLIVPLFILNSCNGCGNSSKRDSNKPLFQIELKAKTTSLFTDEVLPIEVRVSSQEESIRKAEYKIKEVEVTNGELFFCDDLSFNTDTFFQKQRQSVEAGNVLNFRLGDQILVFRPKGEKGQATIKLTIWDLKELESSATLVLEVKSAFKAKLVTQLKKVYTTQSAEIGLDILSKDKDAESEAYTVKNIDVTYGQLQFKNGEVVKQGSKLQYGKQELIFKAPKELDDGIVQQGGYLGSFYFPGKAKATIKLTVEDDRGCERSASLEMEVIPVIFHVGVANIRWNKYETDPTSDEDFSLFGSIKGDRDSLLDKGFTEITLEIKDTKEARESGSYLEEDFGRKAWKLIDCQCSDGSPVTVVDLGGEELVGAPLTDREFIYFKCRDMKLGIPATLTLRIEGPCNTIQELDIKISAIQKSLILDNKISQFLISSQQLNQDIIDNLKTISASSKKLPFEIRKATDLSQKSAEQIDYFESSWSQIKNPQQFSGLVSEATLSNLKNVMMVIAALKYNKSQLDQAYSL